MDKHTQAPWVVDASMGPLRILASDERATIVADNLGSAKNDTAWIDARLIAAAPDLLEALDVLHSFFDKRGQSIARIWSNIPPEKRIEFVRKARAAIRKARGECE